ncbi:hypothetical protein CWE15_08415 [Aliidiomarina taiwanensis]|uniref:Uncharacterized protein n=1 Tax=Aliidiomarina taiwanensis TaxID=946228 RepID=A0A432X0Z4_9GAMM|nr:hypothetical protein CWE15_08415 [Aliidiomarina taiwanensis]
MFEELQNKQIKVYINCSQWNEYYLTGDFLKVKDNWMYLDRKGRTEIILIESIKRITILS